MDIGQPKDYLKGVQLYLKSNKNLILSKGKNRIGEVLIHETAKISESALLGPNVVIGENCSIGDGVRL